MTITYQPIGVIHSPFKDIEGMPIQPTSASAAGGTVELRTEYMEGLKDLEGFSHLILIYHFHQTRHTRLTVTPFLDTEPRGVFATRSPNHPNPLGISVVTLLAIHDNILEIQKLDILDGTPLLDIKPYVPEFDHREGARIGWLAQNRQGVRTKRADDRFKT